MHFSHIHYRTFWLGQAQLAHVLRKLSLPWGIMQCKWYLCEHNIQHFVNFETTNDMEKWLYMMKWWMDLRQFISNLHIIVFTTYNWTSFFAMKDDQQYQNKILFQFSHTNRTYKEMKRNNVFKLRNALMRNPWWKIIIRVAITHTGTLYAHSN